MLSWEYEGESKSTGEAVDILQVAKPGDVLMHDVFGLCTLLSEPCADAGSFMVVLHSDNQMKELTRGHFQFHSTRSSVRDARKEESKTAHSAGTKIDDVLTANETGQPTLQQPPASLTDAPGKGNSGTNGENGSSVAELKEQTGADGNAAEEAKVEDSKKEDGGGGGKKDDSKGDSNDSTAENADEESAIFKLVVAAMQKQCREYELDPRGMELTFFKSLVMMDTSGIIKSPGSEPGENGGIRVGQYVRERLTGYFFVVCRIYKPLLGFLVDRTDGVTVDEEGEQHTLQVAKLSRMLGGNTGYFSGDVNSVLIVLKNAKFDVVWLSCETPNLAVTFDLSPAMSDVAHAAGEQDYQKYASDAVENYADVYHRSDPSVPGGGTAIKETFLRGTVHVATLFKRRGSKAYLTASEAEVEKAEAAEATEAKKAANTAKKKAADAAKAAAAQQQKENKKAHKAKAATAAAAAAVAQKANNKRKVHPILLDDESDSDGDGDGDDEDDEGDEVEKIDENTAPNKRARRQPAAKERLRQPAASARNKPRGAKEPEKPAGVEQPPGAGQPTCTTPPANGSTVSAAYQHFCEDVKPKPLPSQQLPLGSNIPNIDGVAAATLKNMSGVASTQGANVQGANVQGTNVQSANVQAADAQAASHAQALAMQAAMQASMQGMQNPFMQAFQQQFAFAPHAMPFMPMQAAWPGMCFALLPGATPAAGPGQPSSSSSTSPSLLAIQARVNYQNKRERDLMEAQALFEYHQEKQDKRNS